MSDEKRDDAEETFEGAAKMQEDGESQDHKTSDPDEVEPADSSEPASIFDVFEPPPEVDPNHFGPIPIVPDAEEIPEPQPPPVLAASLLMGEREGAPIGEEVADPDEDNEVEDPGPHLFGDLDTDGLDLDEADDDPDLVEALNEADNANDQTQAGALLSDLFGEQSEPESEHELEPDEEGVFLAQPVSTPQVEEAESSTSLPHWTEPATGQVPAVVAGDQDNDVWSDLSGPRWHGEGPEWAGDDLADVFGFTPPDESAEVIDDDANEYADLPNAGSPQRVPIPRKRRVVDTPSGGGRNVPQAILVGALVAGLALAAFNFGKVTTTALITLIAVLGGLELFNKMREVGVHPATLLGTVACGAMPLAVYHRGPAGFMMVSALMVVFGALWYIVGADTHRPALNMGLTMLGVMWVGGLASFAVLIVHLNDGISILLVAVIVTVVFDTGAYAGGRLLGKTPFHSASPNKTWEGTLIGVVAAMAASGLLGLWSISAFSLDLKHALLVGLVAGIMAPLGDLTESIVKRDLGVKDMGTLLPGHGGVLDRVDGLLFVLPGVYYLALLLL